MRLAVDVDGGAGGGAQPSVTGDVVGVRVGFQHVLDLNADVARELEVLLDGQARVHDGGHARVLVADQIGRAAQVVVDELPEDHRAPIISQAEIRTGTTPGW